jgi:Mn2+/Fe2+ NRAMP family transporter
LGAYVNGRLFNLVAWATTLVLTALSALLLLQSLFPTLL